MDISKMALLGSGAEADIYLFGNKAIKVLKFAGTLSVAQYEAELQGKAYRAGLPVPAVYDVCKIDGKPAIVMEYVCGKTIGKDMLRDMDNMCAYMQTSVDLQMMIHKIEAHTFPKQKDKLKANILASPYLMSQQKMDLLQQLLLLETGTMLCHGDFHVLNLLQTDDDIKIIDWVCSTAGSVPADVCRTYLLYFLSHRELAESYLEIYCCRSKIAKQDVLAWLPVIAGARLGENVATAEVGLLLELVEGKSLCRV